MKNNIGSRNTAKLKPNQLNLKVKTNDRLTGADGLRAIACLSVIIHHFSQRIMVNVQPIGIQKLQSFTLMGNSGVSIFFILSGFLLSYPFWKNYLNNSSCPNIKEYSLRRVARIIPGYYIALAVSTYIIVANHISIEYFWTRLVGGLTFTSCFNYKTFFPTEVNGPLWSISFEVFCYFLMPVFMYGLFKLFGKERSFPKAFLYWIGVFVIIMIFNKVVQVLFTPDNVKRGWQYGLVGGAKFWMPNYNPVGLFGHFSFGIMAAGITNILYRNSQKVSKYKKAYIFDLIGLGALIAAVVFLWFMKDMPEFSFSFQNQPYFFPFYQILIATALAVLPHTNLIGMIVDNIFFRYTAKVSFGLYLWHYIYITIAENGFVKAYGVGQMASFNEWLKISAGILLISYITATISYKFIEMPIVRLANKKKFDTRNHKTIREIDLCDNKR